MQGTFSQEVYLPLLYKCVYLWFNCLVTPSPLVQLLLQSSGGLPAAPLADPGSKNETPEAAGNSQTEASGLVPVSSSSAAHLCKKKKNPNKNKKQQNPCVVLQ